MANITVNQIDMVWQTTVKWAWKRVKIAHPFEFFSSSFNPSRMKLWIANGKYEVITRQSATASPVSMALVGEIISFLDDKITIKIIIMREYKEYKEKMRNEMKWNKIEWN